MPKFDTQLFHVMNGYAAAHPAFGEFVALCAGPLIWLMAIAVAVRALSLIIRKNIGAAAFVTAALRAGAAAGMALLGNWLFGRFIWFRERPFVDLYDVQLLTAPPYGWQSFPSGHSAAAFAVAASIYFVDKQAGIMLYIAAVAVALGRVFSGVHYPLDVLAGAVCGVAWAYVARAAGRKIGDEAAATKIVKPMQS